MKKMKKKLFALLLAGAVSMSFMENTVPVNAIASDEVIPESPHGDYVTETTIYHRGYGSHKIYLNLWIGDEQLYQVCNVTYTIYKDSVYCGRCGIFIGSTVRPKPVITHSLGCEE